MTEGLTDLIKYGDANYNAYRYVPNELSYGETSVVDANYVATYLGKLGQSLRICSSCE
ncbi:hypothetical protein NXU94_24385 [Bacteroides faecis]|uniref:hypothetical protein n=1 Tax=Bacteroides faecis TaxID=674529 RepID=UPI0021660333|nr:hypothetical protein [Bacteroides faecis]MCS3070108.1 hypothetical protein [Bacteroides faecis]